MSKKLIVGKFTMFVENISDKEEFVKYLKAKRVAVQDDDNFQLVADFTPSDVETLLQQAKEFSTQDPPDVVEFSERIWCAASLIVTQYFLENHSLLIESHSAKTSLARLICLGLSSGDAWDFSDGWKDGEQCYENFFQMQSIPKPRRENMLANIVNMNSIVKKTDCQLVESALTSLKNLKIQKSKQGSSFKIGSRFFYYGRCVY